MTSNVTLPLWFVILIGLFAMWTLLSRFLLPGIQWYSRRRSNIIIQKINKKLALKLPEFKLTKRQVLIDRLVYDTKVMEAVKEYSRVHEVPNEIPLKKVTRYAREIVPSFNAYTYFRFGSWINRSIARLLYRVRVGYADESGLIKIPTDSSVVFIMNHRSNMDYILLAHLSLTRVALSFAVGEWARVWPLQQLIRAMGAYFVRRGSGNPLYRSVLARYVQMATEEGVVQAIFPEGKLTRNGKMGDPKIGLLDYMLRNFDPNKKDIIFIPVGVNYDRVLEDRSQLLSLDPDAEKKSGFSSLKTMGRFLFKNLWLMFRGGWYRFGYAVTNFGTPISLRDYLIRQKIDFIHTDKAKRIAIVQGLAENLMSALGDIIPVVPVPLVAKVFLDNGEETLSLLEIKARAQGLMEKLREKGAHVYIPRKDAEYAVETGLRMLTLRRLVKEEDGLFRVVKEEIPLLRYYAGSIAHLL